MACKRGGAIFHFNVTDLACVKILKVKVSYFRVNLETFCARKVGEHGSDFYQDCSKDWIASKWQNLRILCIWCKIWKQNFSRFKHGRVLLLKHDAWNWLNFSQNEEKWYSDNFQEPSKGAQHQITTRFM